MSNRSGQAAIGLIGIFFALFVFALLVFLGFPLKIAVFAILGVSVFVLAFFNTDIALIILIFSMLLSPEIQTGAITGRAVVIRVEDLLLIVVFFGWMAKMAINKELGVMKATPLNAPIKLYVLVCIVTSIIAILQGRLELKESLFYILKYVEYFLLFFMVVNNVRSAEQAKRFIFFLFLTCFLVSLYGVAQIAGSARVSAPFEGKGGEPNTFAGYLLIMMSLIIGFLLYPNPGMNRLMLTGLLGISGIAFVMTLSRSGWLSFFPMFLMFIVMNKRFRALLIGIFIIGAIMVPILAPHAVEERFKETFTAYRTYKVMGRRVGIDESTTARIDSWKIGFNRWTKRPIFGYGVPAGVTIDNQYTRVLNETGVVGFVIFLWLLATIFGVVWRIRETMQEDMFARAMTTGFLAGFAGVLLLSTGAATFIIIRIMEPFWFILGIIIALPDLGTPEGTRA